jgi:hypothetical protein
MKGIVKKLSISAAVAIVAGAGLLVMSNMGVYAATSLSGTIATTTNLVGDYELSGDVDLTTGGKLFVAAGQTATLDLNGYSLTTNGSSNQIHIKGTLTVTDSGDPKGEIECKNNTSLVCIKNDVGGTTTINGVTVKSVHAAAKADENSTLIINNSTLITSGSSGAVQTYGDTTITNSTLTNTNANPGNSFAVWAMVYDYPTSVDITNSTLDAATAIYTRCNDTDCSGGTSGSPLPIVVDITGGVITGETFSVNSWNGSSAYTSAELTISGSVTGPMAAVEYMQPGATITLNRDVTGGSYTIPAGVTLIIPDNVVFEDVTLDNKGTVKTASGKELVQNPDGTFSAEPIRAGDLAPSKTAVI